MNTAAATQARPPVHPANRASRGAPWTAIGVDSLVLPPRGDWLGPDDRDSAVVEEIPVTGELLRRLRELGGL